MANIVYTFENHVYLNITNSPVKSYSAVTASLRALMIT